MAAHSLTRTHGALVAGWWIGRLLLVESSYRRSWSLPGGGVGLKETVRKAAVGELREELELAVEPEQLRPPLDNHGVLSKRLQYSDNL